MPIDEKVLIEELKNPEVLDKVFTLVSETDLFKNKTKSLQEQYYEQNKGKEHGYAYGLVDEAFKNAGIPKPDNMKTSEYAAQVAKEKLQLQKELDILKAEKSGQNVDEKVQKIEAKYKKDLEDMTNNYTTKLSELEKQLINERTTNQIQGNLTQLSAELGKIQFIASIPKTTIDRVAQFELNQLAKNATVENGKVIWNDENGKPIKNSNHLNASTEEVLKSVFKDFIQVGTAGGGAQGGGSQSRMEGNVLLLSNNNFKTQVEFAAQYKKDLAAQGKTMSDKNASEIFLATKKYYNVDAMKES